MNAQEKKYFQENILMQIGHSQREDERLWCARFFVGPGSKAVPGAGPSQNATENMIKCAKDPVIWKGKTMTEIEYLTKVTQRFEVAVRTTGRNGWLGPDQSLKVPTTAKSLLSTASHDLLSGPGRAFKCFGKSFWFPSADNVLDAQAMHGSALVKQGNFYIVKKYWVRKTDYRVSLRDATDLVATLKCHRMAEVRTCFRNIGLVSSSEEFQLERAEELFENLACVNITSFECSCSLYRDTGECGHAFACMLFTNPEERKAHQKIKKKRTSSKPKKGKGKGRSAGWQNPDDVDEEAAAWSLLLSPYCVYTWWDITCVFPVVREILFQDPGGHFLYKMVEPGYRAKPFF